MTSIYIKENNVSLNLFNTRIYDNNNILYLNISNKKQKNSRKEILY